MQIKTFKKTGFTLAEVLITLSIIGVVAALTIPTLIQRTGDEEMVSKLMKAYSTLSQATESIMTEQGSPRVWDTNSKNLYEAYKSHLRNAKECSSGQGCWKSFGDDGSGYKTLRGGLSSSDWNTDENRGKLILADGVQVMFVHYSDDCSSDINGSKNFCSLIAVDLNGDKKPNIWGRDVFMFVLKESGLYPRGCDYDSCEGTDGEGCACKVIQEGKIDY